MFRAEYQGENLGCYATLAAAEVAIRIAQDPYGPEAVLLLVLGDEEFWAAANQGDPTYKLVG